MKLISHKLGLLVLVICYKSTCGTVSSLSQSDLEEIDTNNGAQNGELSSQNNALLDAEAAEQLDDSDSSIEDDIEDMMYDDEDDDYYDSWQSTVMEPLRGVGQSISNTVNNAAQMLNAGADAAANWWNGGSGDGFDDYDEDFYENYDTAEDQVNAWWKEAMEQDYNYDEDDEDEVFDNVKSEVENTSDEDDYDDEDYDDDDYDYYELYQAIKYPKPSESKVEASQIHHPKDNKIQLTRMRSRTDMPYAVDDYFDFVVIAMCVVLLFIMLLAGVSRYNNQRYLKKTYGKKSEERTPLIA